jgi:hypothetical protein
LRPLRRSKNIIPRCALRRFSKLAPIQGKQFRGFPARRSLTIADGIGEAVWLGNLSLSVGDRDRRAKKRRRQLRDSPEGASSQLLTLRRNVLVADFAPRQYLGQLRRHLRQ